MPAANRVMSLRPVHPCWGSWRNEGFFPFHSSLEMKTRILDLNLYLECAFRRGGLQRQLRGTHYSCSLSGHDANIWSDKAERMGAKG